MAKLARLLLGFPRAFCSMPHRSALATGGVVLATRPLAFGCPWLCTRPCVGSIGTFRMMSTGGPPPSPPPHMQHPFMQGTPGGGGSGSSKGRGGGISWWPLGLAAVTAFLTQQTGRGIAADKTYTSMAERIDKGDDNYLGGLHSLVHWLHLFGHGPAGQDLRRRLAQAGCVEALIRQEGECHKMLGEVFRQIAASASFESPDKQRELQGRVVQAFWKRESCLLALSELLQGSASARDMFFETAHDALLTRLLDPPRDGAADLVMTIIHNAGLNPGQRPVRNAIHGDGAGGALRGTHVDPFSRPGQQGVAGGAPWDDKPQWEEGSSGGADEAAQSVGGAGETSGKDPQAGSRRWSASQVRLLQVLAKDERLAAVVLENPDTIACFADNLAPTAAAPNGFLRAVELDRQRGILKVLLDIVRNGGGKARAFTSERSLEQRLGELSSARDPILRGFARMAVKELVDSGAEFPSLQGSTWLQAEGQVLAIATEDELKPATIRVQWGRLLMKLPIVAMCGAAWGTGRAYSILRKRTVVPLPNIMQTASRAGARTAVGASLIYISTVAAARYLHEYSTTKLQTPSEVVYAVGGTATSELALLFLFMAAFPYSFGGFCFSSFVSGPLGGLMPSAFGPVLVMSNFRERQSGFQGKG